MIPNFCSFVSDDDKFALLMCWLLCVGGHTAEILSLVRSMHVQQYAPRFYIAGATDKMSLIKAEGDEAQMLEDFRVQVLGFGSARWISFLFALARVLLGF